MSEKREKENCLELRGKKVYLIKLSADHRQEYFDSVLNISEQTNALTLTSALFTREQIEKHIENSVFDRSRLDLLIFETRSEHLLGEVVFMEIDRESRSADFRIAVFKEENFGRGFGQEAGKLALNYVFGMFHLHRVSLEVLVQNERALHVYEKLGFSREGVKRESTYYNHKFHNLLMMSILEDEFRALHKDCVQGLREKIKTERQFCFPES